jgi:hypothetical protein
LQEMSLASGSSCLGEHGGGTRLCGRGNPQQISALAGLEIGSRLSEGGSWTAPGALSMGRLCLCGLVRLP